MADLQTDDVQSNGFEVTIKRQRTRTGSQLPVTNYTADLQMVTHDGKLWSLQDLNLMSFEVLHGLYRTAGQLPHKIHTLSIWKTMTHQKMTQTLRLTNGLTL
jgi:hypothetical protein